MNLRNACFTASNRRSNRIPAEAFALLFVDFFEDGERLWAAVLAAGGEDGIDERDGSGVGSAEGSGFDAREEDFVAFAGEGRDIGIRDPDTIRITVVGQVNTFNSLAKAASKTNRNDEIVFIYRAH